MSFVYNAAKTMDVDWLNDTIKALMLKATSTVDPDHNTVSDVLAGNLEADFTNYTRLTLTGKTKTVDDVNDRADLDAADPSIAAAGGTLDNSIDRIIIYKEITNDTDSIPLLSLDYSFTTDGRTLIVQWPTPIWRLT